MIDNEVKQANVEASEIDMENNNITVNSNNQTININSTFKVQENGRVTIATVNVE